MSPARLLARARTLTVPERRLLVSAWLDLALIRALLALLPFRILRGWAERGTARPRAAGPAAARAAALVEAAGRHHVVAATCLARALVLCRILGRRGLPARLVVGAARTEQGLAAHAWVECEGETLGAAPDGRFEPLLGHRHAARETPVVSHGA
jgi:hypothetical protein